MEKRFVRRALALAMAGTASVACAAPNGLARTPPRGWDSWNGFHRNISDALFRDTADAMVNLGLLDAGYNRVNIDGGWWLGVDTGTIVRNASGFMQEDTLRFPAGMADLVSYVHSRGLLWGHYTDAGTHACNGDTPMSEGYEAQDVALFASWGADMLKLDACAVQDKDKEGLMGKWAALLNATGRPIVFSNCRNGCMSQPSTPAPARWQPWCASLLNMWRTSEDINATWQSMLTNADSLKGRGGVAGPGAWNDPDFLEVGIGEFALPATDPGNATVLDMNAAHFALWSVTSSPLILGFDLRPAANPSPALLAMVTNPLALRINAEYNPTVANAGDYVGPGQGGGQAGTEVWAKPLLGGQAGVVLFNRNATAPTDISIPLASLPGLPPAAASCATTDVWSGKQGSTGPGGVLTATAVPVRAAAFLLVGNCTSSEAN